MQPSLTFISNRTSQCLVISNQPQICKGRIIHCDIIIDHKSYKINRSLFNVIYTAVQSAVVDWNSKFHFCSCLISSIFCLYLLAAWIVAMTHSEKQQISSGVLSEYINMNSLLLIAFLRCKSIVNGTAYFLNPVPIF